MAERTSGPFTLSETAVGLHPDGTARLIEGAAGPPPRIDGFTVGAPVMTRNPPHAGEMHPDADELLFLVSGRISVLLEESAGTRTHDLEPGQAIIVPRGVWHRVLIREPSQLVHVTPGPGGEHRPLPRTGS